MAANFVQGLNESDEHNLLTQSMDINSLSIDVKRGIRLQSLSKRTLKGEKIVKGEEREEVNEVGEMKETDRMETSEERMKEER